MSDKKHYGIFNFLVDIILTVITGGLWAIYKLFKYISSR